MSPELLQPYEQHSLTHFNFVVLVCNHVTFHSSECLYFCTQASGATATRTQTQTTVVRPSRAYDHLYDPVHMISSSNDYGRIQQRSIIQGSTPVCLIIVSPFFVSSSPFESSTHCHATVLFYKQTLDKPTPNSANLVDIPSFVCRFASFLFLPCTCSDSRS